MLQKKHVLWLFLFIQKDPNYDYFLKVIIAMDSFIFNKELVKKLKRSVREISTLKVRVKIIGKVILKNFMWEGLKYVKRQAT